MTYDNSLRQGCTNREAPDCLVQTAATFANFTFITKFPTVFGVLMLHLLRYLQLRPAHQPIIMAVTLSKKNRLIYLG
jgi:hypothetical protein